MSSLRLTPIYPQNIHQYPILFINPYHIPISHPSCQPMTPTPRHSAAAANSSTASPPFSADASSDSCSAARSCASSGSSAARRLGARAPWQSEAKALQWVCLVKKMGRGEELELRWLETLRKVDVKWWKWIEWKKEMRLDWMIHRLVVLGKWSEQNGIKWTK